MRLTVSCHCRLHSSPPLETRGYVKFAHTYTAFYTHLFILVSFCLFVSLMIIKIININVPSSTVPPLHPFKHQEEEAIFVCEIFPLSASYLVRSLSSPQIVLISQPRLNSTPPSPPADSLPRRDQTILYHVGG